jgi:hypothetical protein
MCDGFRFLRSVVRESEAERKHGMRFEILEDDGAGCQQRRRIAAVDNIENRAPAVNYRRIRGIRSHALLG